ncbi:MAG: hypothetical protein KJ852_04250 [Gammaproteobacteria bacterium]|nr:hypothetical protein [Gammaproteobacteria bacterium]MBU0786606.1 hypothetical protein [Gammaproteobacteria bacterium]MBU0814323.1 hypothetical protein [Gammaproteobacteria bacterium]MBU1786157.1 hypothetical protein [Gammaproteobacteria bacterium]
MSNSTTITPLKVVVIVFAVIGVVAVLCAIGMGLMHSSVMSGTMMSRM